LDRAKLVLLSAFASAVIGVHANSTAWAWGNQAHEIVAIIAADNLSPSAREQVTRILGTPQMQALLKRRWPPRQYALTPNSGRRPVNRSLALH
jgi:hypothetical protein